MPEFNEINKILARYPEITTEEEIILKEWLTLGSNEEYFRVVTDNKNKIELIERLDELTAQTPQMWEQFHARFIDIQKTRKLWWYSWQTYIAAASIIVIAVIVGLKWWGTKKNVSKIEPSTLVVQKNDIQPGTFRATLTLDDNSVMQLDSFSSKIVQQGGTNIYTKDGRLIYEPKGIIDNKVLYNTLTTANGQMYATVLADGSKVWLNSQSSIRYPVSFSEDRREVEIKGEAYFEVAKQKIPFIVKGVSVEIEVLGTHFNVNNYNDEGIIRTTLLEGKVKLHSIANSSVIILQPGQEGRLNSETNQFTRIDDVDVDEAVAWKDGFFEFNDTQLKTVLNQIARWYDVEVVYEGGKVPEKKFLGKISRTNSLSQVLVALNSLGIKYAMRGRRLIVSS